MGFVKRKPTHRRCGRLDPSEGDYEGGAVSTTAPPLRLLEWCMAARHTKLKCILALPLALIAAVAMAQEKDINVRDFGARGNGISDDTDAIQRALNSVPQGGATVRLPI